ncbi:hypothetical protein [Embleya sp. NPDC020630]|uniref:hypothetical protein n=1 Tax=Embleya sp. NPDC020630 TaxID=3363979 RepID=UPI0037BD3772
MTTRALATCARLGLADAMETGAAVGLTAPARAVDADPPSLARLLRHLAMPGVVVADPNGFRLTEVGALLRTNSPDSMRPLALMYGGPFHRSLALPTHTVRTDHTGFERLFGENHFDYFAPARRRLAAAAGRECAACPQGRRVAPPRPEAGARIRRKPRPGSARGFRKFGPPRGPPGFHWRAR